MQAQNHYRFVHARVVPLGILGALVDPELRAARRSPHDSLNIRQLRQNGLATSPHAVQLNIELWTLHRMPYWAA
jgi:hypothetical protein